MVAQIEKLECKHSQIQKKCINYVLRGKIGAGDHRNIILLCWPTQRPRVPLMVLSHQEWNPSTYTIPQSVF